MTADVETYSNSGSRWQRWDPHVHAPGTLFNDQYSGPDAWEQCLATFEGLNPPIRAVGVTDYYLLDCYEQIRSEKDNGRLASCDLIFSNVEIRLKFATVKGQWANAHLLISPEDPNHVLEARLFLESLTLEAFGEVFRCKDSI